jgi:hypothetical protein
LQSPPLISIQLIVEYEASTVVFGNANRMFLVLKCIQFAFAWNAIPPHKQDKAKKELYISKDDSLHFAGLSLNEAIAEVESNYLQLYLQWNRKYTRLNVTPRIKLGKIYKTVSPLYVISTPSDIPETGLYILLDPFWVPNNLIEEHLTADLNGILQNLRKDAPRHGRHRPTCRPFQRKSRRGLGSCPHRRRGRLQLYEAH